MEFFIVGPNTLDDFHRLLQGRLGDGHRLEPALQCRILFDVLPVFLEGGGADDLHLSPGQGRLENVGGVHGAFGIPRPHQIVHFVDDQNNIAQALDLID